ncbi:MAG: HAD-IA family hydrolase [Pseudomonadota bacterium]
MSYAALLLESIGVLADTSDLQRRAFNTAFVAHGVDWHWDRAAYAELLEVPGGKNRLDHYAERNGHEVDIDALYEAKLAAFEEGLARGGLSLRPGIDDLIIEARLQGMKLGFVTSTEPRQVQMVMDALSDVLNPAIFDYIGSGNRVPRGKPAPDIYNDALRELGVEAADALAIEDTPESAAAATAAGIATWGYPSVAEGRDFGDVIGAGFPDLDLVRQVQPAVAAQ